MWWFIIGETLFVCWVVCFKECIGVANRGKIVSSVLLCQVSRSMGLVFTPICFMFHMCMLQFSCATDT